MAKEMCQFLIGKVQLEQKERGRFYEKHNKCQFLIGKVQRK